MQIMERSEVFSLREKYPVGTRVSLVSTTDPYTRLKSGAKGTVRHIDDAGTIHVRWDCGSGLGLVPGEDVFRKIRH